jgi:hypothetical protein
MQQLRRLIIYSVYVAGLSLYHADGNISINNNTAVSAHAHFVDYKTRNGKIIVQLIFSFVFN